MLGQGADEGTEGGDTVGEELNGFMFIGDDGGDWMPIAPLGKRTIETFDPEFDAAVEVPIYSTLYEHEITFEMKINRRWIRKLRYSLWGWKASGPLRLRNICKAARLRGRR